MLKYEQMWSFYFHRTLQKAQWEAEGRDSNRREENHPITGNSDRTLWRQVACAKIAQDASAIHMCLLSTKVLAGGPDSSTKLKTQRMDQKMIQLHLRVV